MKTSIKYSLAGLLLGFAALALLGAMFDGDQYKPLTVIRDCPSITRGALALPDGHSGDMATLLNAADVLNNKMSVCVIEGGWSERQRTFYLTVIEPGSKTAPTIRRYNGAELRSLASLGQR